MSPSDYQEYDLNYPHLSSLAFMLSWGNQWRSSCMLCPWLQGWRAARRRRKQSSETSKSKSSCLSRSALLLTLGGVLSKCLDSLHYDKHCFFNCHLHTVCLNKKTKRRCLSAVSQPVYTPSGCFALWLCHSHWRLKFRTFSSFSSLRYH